MVFLYYFERITLTSLLHAVVHVKSWIETELFHVMSMSTDAESEILELILDFRISAVNLSKL